MMRLNQKMPSALEVLEDLFPGRQLLPMEYVAETLGFTPRGLRQSIANGLIDIPVHKHKGILCLDIATLAGYIEDNCASQLGPSDPARLRQHYRWERRMAPGVAPAYEMHS